MKFRRRTAGSVGRTEIPQMLLKALDLLDSKALVVMPGEVIAYQSTGLDELGMTRSGRIASEELMALIREVRRGKAARRISLDLSQGTSELNSRKLSISATSLSDDGVVLALIVDESEARRIEAVRRDFVANVSHELKTPIGALSLLSEAILGAKDQPNEVARFATRMQGEARRLSELVQEIIDLSRLQSSDPMRAPLPVSVSDVVGEAVNQAQISAESRGIELDVGNVDSGVVIGDRNQLIVAVHNLIENAINYSPDNTKVSITSRFHEGSIDISVADQGMGIPSDEQNRIFERFYRVDPARSRATGGTGLGLSIVKHVALNHGGDVKVWSKVGVGSTFTISLPATKEEIA